MQDALTGPGIKKEKRRREGKGEGGARKKKDRPRGNYFVCNSRRGNLSLYVAKLFLPFQCPNTYRVAVSRIRNESVT